ncbi:MAG TPA: DUF1800 domain-containing protein [Acidimicrobiales bacterium]|nr:DUF1800 domain-containing protein [Acidimicrobiales bacterium]
MRPPPAGGPAEPADPDPYRLRRRALVGGLAGTGLAAAVLLKLRGGSSTDVVTPPPPDPVERAAAVRARDAGGFASRDESFARSVGEPATPPPSAAPSTLFPTAGAAAANTRVTVPTILATDDPAMHLLRRMAFGPTQAMVDEVHAKGIDAWLAEQLDPGSIPDGEAEGVAGLFPLATMAPSQIRGSMERFSWDAMMQFGQATMARQIWSQRQLFEVMVDFWADHVHVATPGEGGWDVGPSFHNDVIRRHALGSFTDMLLAATRHPAMLRYLTNDDNHKDSVNENLGRELLELHTVGVASGYTEDDVRNSAYILTGRTVAGEMDERGEEGTFVWDPDSHWTGAVRVLDFTHDNASADGGLDVGDAYVRYLAAHPSTARTIGRKLAVRFVADDPPKALVDRLAQAFVDSGTQITPVLDVMLRSGEFWAAVGQKVKRPLENLVSSVRVLGVRPGGDTKKVVENLYWSAGQMGHRPLAWPAPNGYPDVHAAWRSANGLLEVWNAHRGLVQGWNEGLTYTAPDQLIGDRPRGTVGEYVDSLCLRLCFQTFQGAHRDALIAFTGAGADTPTADTDLAASVHHLAPLVLDAPYFALR